MRALTWHGKRDVRVDDVEDPRLLDERDALVRITSTAICGSDLHLYELMGPYLHRGDILGHEAMGEVVEVGESVRHVAPGDRVVIVCQLACGDCFMCRRGLQSQCELTQNREHGTMASLFGYTELYGHVPGLQAEFARIPLADQTLIRVDEAVPDERVLFLGDVIPTAWQAVRYADAPPGEVVVVLGLGPVGQLAARMARHLGHGVIGVDPVPERRAMAERHDIVTLDFDDDLPELVRGATDGRGPGAVIDAVGTEAHGDPVAAFGQEAGTVLPTGLARAMLQHAAVDRMAALHLAIDVVRRGGTVSLSGVYTGLLDPVPMKLVWDKELTIRAGAVNVRRWLDEVRPLAEHPDDPMGLDDFVTHRRPLEDAPEMYERFQKKQDGCIKVVLRP